jgi:hypothetical protein
MSSFKQLEEFERRFPHDMDVAELCKWKAYWTQHASHLQPKVRKVAMKRVRAIDKAIAAKASK